MFNNKKFQKFVFSEKNTSKPISPAALFFHFWQARLPNENLEILRILFLKSHFMISEFLNPELN